MKNEKIIRTIRFFYPNSRIHSALVIRKAEQYLSIADVNTSNFPDKMNRY